ncbi:MAG: hypothetical protein ACE5GA_08320, partial [Candidatus Zixiibacteriota bacterium]
MTDTQPDRAVTGSNGTPDGAAVNPKRKEIGAAVEALIFSSPDPLPSQKITEALGKVGLNTIKKAI